MHTKVKIEIGAKKILMLVYLYRDNLFRRKFHGSVLAKNNISKEDYAFACLEIGSNLSSTVKNFPFS